jgi:8-oxo-dGTP pyrophosphatase MutT (NUDIX family)
MHKESATKNAITDQFLLDIVYSSNLFCKWHSRFLLSGCTIVNITVRGAVLFKNKKLHSTYLEVKFVTPEGQTLTRSILLRGSSVVIIPMVYTKDKVQPRFLMVQQRRIFNGEFSLEFPSGKLEDNVNPTLAAQQELQEECGVSMSRDNLIQLSENMVVCESAFDESVYWFYCILNANQVPDEIAGIPFGEKDGEEFTYPRLLNAEDAFKINSFQVKTGLQLLSCKNLI